ncbi:MAG: LCP family protein [Acidimicrobiales bacterium]
MASSRPPGDPFGSPYRRRRGSPSYEDGLRVLGSQIGGGPDRAPVANESGLRALGDQVDEAGGGGGGGRRGGGRGPGGGGRGGHGPGGGRRRNGRKRWSTRRKILTPIVALVVLALLVVGGAYGYARYRYDQIKKVHVASEQQQVTGQPFNMLVIGSDTRVGDKSGTQTYGTASQVGGQRSDVTMIWHVDPATKQISVISIPRDTLVSMVGKNVTTFGQFNRINSSYNSGPTLLVQTIQDNFGIPISHVVQVNFSGFKGAVNALGGIHMNFKYPTRTFNETPATYGVNESGLNVGTPGCVLLTGTQALAVARSRHFQYYATGQWNTTPSGDLGRIKRQDGFLRALIDEAKGKYNPLTLNAFLGSLPQGLAIDTGFSLSQMIGLAEDFHGINPTAIQTTTLPTFTVGYVTPWGDVLFVQQPEAQQLLVSVFGSELTTPSSPPPNTALVSAQPPAVTTGGSAATGTAAPAGGTTSGTAASGGATTATTSPPPPSYDPTPC